MATLPEAKGDFGSRLFFQRFNKHLDHSILKLKKDQEAKDRLDLSGRSEISKVAMERGRTNSKESTSLSRRTRLPKNLLTAYHSQPPKKHPHKRKVLPTDSTLVVGNTGRLEDKEQSLGCLSQVAKDMRLLFTQIPKLTAQHVKREGGRSPGRPNSRGTGATGPFPRVSASSTPGRQPVPPTDSARSRSQHRPKVSGRREKEKLDITSFHEFFSQFHQKSRHLLQQLEANILRK